MNNETIKNVMQISKRVIRLDLDLHNSSDHTKPYPIIANYFHNKQNRKTHGAPLTRRDYAKSEKTTYPSPNTTKTLISFFG